MQKKKWYEKYLPFVARSPGMQIRWLETAKRKGALTDQEIMPYVTLLLAHEGEKQEELKAAFRNLNDLFVEQLLIAAEIQDVPKLFSLIEKPVVRHAVVALGKAPRDYEQAPQLLTDKVFMAVNLRSPGLLEEAVQIIMAGNGVPEHFLPAYERFKEIIEGEKILSALYPKAKAE
jgi:hypothetical protein